MSIANSAFSVANNYPPQLEAISTQLILRPENCGFGSPPNNLSCTFRGVFNVSFTIIGPHVGTYNLSILGIDGIGPFSPHPVAYFPGENGWVVKIGNATISSYPPLRAAIPLVGAGVPAGQPFDKTVEVEVEGLTLTAPSVSYVRELNFIGLATLTAILTYTDIPMQRTVPKTFVVQVIFLAM